jgi:hypothetical protein
LNPFNSWLYSILWQRGCTFWSVSEIPIVVFFFNALVWPLEGPGTAVCVLPGHALVPPTLVPASTHSLIPVPAIPIAAAISGSHSVLTFAPVGVTAALPSLTDAIPIAVFLPGRTLLPVTPAEFAAFVIPAPAGTFPHSAVAAKALITAPIVVFMTTRRPAVLAWPGLLLLTAPIFALVAFIFSGHELSPGEQLTRHPMIDATDIEVKSAER